MADSAPFDVPDFRDPIARQAFANDHWSPNPAESAPGQPLPGILGNVEPAPEAYAYAREV